MDTTNQHNIHSFHKVSLSDSFALIEKSNKYRIWEITHRWFFRRKEKMSGM